MKRNVVVVSIAALMFGLILLGYATETINQVLSEDEVAIHFSVEGSGEPALVFVHCWCCDRSYWKHQLAYFAERHRVVAIDLAGHGESGMERSEWTVQAFAKDVVAVVKKLDLDRVILIGHSMGGPVNLEAARRMPERIIGLVGVDTYQDFERHLPEAQREQFLAAFKTDFEATTKGFVRMMFPADADSALVEEIANDMSSAPPEVGIGAIESVLSYKQVEALDEITIPIRCINSDRFPTNEETGKRHAESYEVKYMSGRGHFLMLEDPEVFNTLLTETIAELVGD
ncbi:MAG: alpha/beta hydrolase [Candidatus Latescibacterota bacterium]|nr:MAG: alpha/beta hydrolase [Candidatus Latescibacterota bacterium]